jgi:hypothetical protein
VAIRATQAADRGQNARDGAVVDPSRSHHSAHLGAHARGAWGLRIAAASDRMNAPIEADTSREPRSSSERVFSLLREIEGVHEWALAPLRDADRIAAELIALADRRALPPGALRMLTQAALGEPVRLAVVDRWIEEDPEVQQVLSRVREVGRALEGASTRARAASRRALALALDAPQLVRHATREVWQQGPSVTRDQLLRRLADAPGELKARSEAIRSELASLQIRADAARARILDGVRVRAPRRRTDRLLAI